MNTSSTHPQTSIATIALAAVLAWSPAGCSPEKPLTARPDPESPITNRLAVTPEVISNLGVTFERATRGKLGIWLTVPGQIEIPEHRRHLLRAPAEGRLLAIAPLWTQVQEGELLAELNSSELRQAQQALLNATLTREDTGRQARAARERLIESEQQLERAQFFARASRKRLDELLVLTQQGGALSSKELLQAREIQTRAAQDELDAALARDDLDARAAAKERLLALSGLQVNEHLEQLSLLTGHPAAELTRLVDGRAAWQTLDRVRVLAPAAGTVVEILGSQGEALEHGARLLSLADTTELRFRGQVPEGDMNLLEPGLPLWITLPSGGLEPIESRSIGPLPVADPLTRTLRLEAVISNPEDRIPYGISATAEVLIREGQHEEVLAPLRCVVFDGLEAIVFKRDPSDPQSVVRTPVELGLRAAGRVELLSGVLEGDELVADGVHQLKRTGLGKPPAGGHFHADGSWHKEDE